MHVEQVAPDDTMPVSGYEHRTLKCPQCGDTERRLVFVGDRASAESTSVETTNPVVETTISVVETTIPVVEPTIPVIETTIPVAEPTIPVVETTIPVVEPRISIADRGQDQPGVASDAGSVAKWAQAVEKVRTRHTALARAVAAENKPAKTAATRSNEAADDFDRMWESPVPPRQQPPPRSEPSPPQRRDDPLRGTTPPPATTPRTPFRRPDTPFAPVRSDAAAAPAGLKRAPESKSSQTKTLPTKTLPTKTLPTKTLPTETLPTETLPTETLPTETLPTETLQSNTPQGNTSQGAWARAVAMLRERLDRATKLDRNDTILRIDDDALKVKPRQGQSRPPKPDCPD
jgi:hypothetical protein